MKINEFKPDNIVYTKDHQGRVIENPIRIIERYGDEYSFQFYNTKIIPNYNDVIEVNRLCGIPLSKEWVKIFGFDQKYQNNWYKENVRVVFDDRGHFKGLFIVKEEKPLFEGSFSVSDLQNLFFELIGIELK